MLLHEKKIFVYLCLIVLSFAIFSCSPSTNEAPRPGLLESATLVRVVDGDTLIVKVGNEEKRVRLILVDTPESVHPDPNRNTDYGKKASEYTDSQLKENQIVYLQKDVSETDRYGRLLRYVWLDQPTSLDDSDQIRNSMYNSKLILAGYAQVATYPPDVRYAELFTKFAAEARETQAGLWSYQLNTAVPEHTGDIKGNINSKGEKIYHVPGGRYYDQTVAEEYFTSEKEAEAAGFRKSKL